MLDADHDDDAPLHFRKVHSLIDAGAATPSPIERELLLFTAADEPALLAEAQEQSCWHKVMQVEMDAIEANGTWVLVDPPARR
jgi:hypothetical protein